MRLADLLTEALMAYQNVRDRDADTGPDALRASDASGAQPGPTSVPEITSWSFSSDAGGLGLGRSRRSSDEPDTEPRWTLPTWDLPAT